MWIRTSKNSLLNLAAARHVDLICIHCGYEIVAGFGTNNRPQTTKAVAAMQVIAADIGNPGLFEFDDNGRLGEKGWSFAANAFA
jgi:hypothetical protein